MNSHVSGRRLAGDQQPGRWPVRSGTVPPLADFFSTRPETGLELSATPAAGEMVVLTPPAQPGSAVALAASNGSAGGVLAGTGGTGKTQLAAAAAHTLWDSAAVDLLVWVPAVSRDSILAGYMQAGAAVGAPGNGAPPERAAACFADWLAATRRPWLLVLDDLADLTDLTGLWPRGRAGRVVVTTRLPAAAVLGPERTVIEIGGFSPREALTYLTASLYPEQRAQAVDLATDLDCLPLSLSLAAAAMTETGGNCGQYRAYLQQRRQQMALPHASQHARTVAAAWSIALDRADAAGPVGQARTALALIALLDCGGIPAAVLTSQAACEFICGRDASGTPADEDQVRQTLGRLSQAGLITVSPDAAARTVAMHPLVQATALQVLPPDMREFTAAAAASALMQAWPYGDQDPLIAQALRDCTASLHRAAADLLWTPEAHPVLLRAGQSLDRARLPGLAIAYWQAMIATGTQILGPGDASIFAARDRLAAACEAAGRPLDAVAALEISTAQRERLLGRDHPEAMAARCSLAHAHLAAGHVDYATMLYEGTLSDQEQTLGSGHPDTLTTRGDLAGAYRAAGRMQAAVTALERTLSEREAALGASDPRTLTACADLASTLLAWGRTAAALPLSKRALNGRERALGPDHPDTMTARASLANVYRLADRLEEALPAYRRVLADRERVLGPDHADTLSAMGNLASACHSARLLTTAIPLYERALHARERTQGPDHPDTLAALGSLASGYHSAGQFTQAIELFEQTLRDCERVLGPDSLQTLTAQVNLASAYHGMGRNAEAVGAFEAALANCERYLPPGHPMTQSTREHLEAAR